jgi:hypothetical protein
MKATVGEGLGVAGTHFLHPARMPQDRAWEKLLAGRSVDQIGAWGSLLARQQVRAREAAMRAGGGIERRVRHAWPGPVHVFCMSSCPQS